VKPGLHVVAPDEVLETAASAPGAAPEPPPVETVAARVRRLQAEAQAAAREHVLQLMLSMSLTRELAKEIASGGDVYPAGIRSIARCIVEDVESRAETLDAIKRRMR
jgi:hypothetical protein